MGHGGIAADVGAHARDRNREVLRAVQSAGSGQRVGSPSGVGVVHVKGVGVSRSRGRAVRDVQGLSIRGPLGCSSHPAENGANVPPTLNR